MRCGGAPGRMPNSKPTVIVMHPLHSQYYIGTERYLSRGADALRGRARAHAEQRVLHDAVDAAVHRRRADAQAPVECAHVLNDPKVPTDPGPDLALRLAGDTTRLEAEWMPQPR